MLTIVAGIAFTMSAVAYGITYIFRAGTFNIPVPYFFFFIFSIGFVIFTVYFEREKKAVYPRELIGGAIASSCLTFIAMAFVTGVKYIWENGFSGIGIETLTYAFSISMIISLIIYFASRKIEVKLIHPDSTRVLSIVLGLALLMMISMVYGINYFLKIDSFPIPPYVIFLIFTIVFVICSVFYEKRGAVYPWFILGSAVASACLTFVITAIIGGLKYIMRNGFQAIGIDTVFYSLSICIILSMILFNQYNIIKEKL